jgi:hypothetical protein
MIWPALTAITLPKAPKSYFHAVFGPQVGQKLHKYKISSGNEFRNDWWMTAPYTGASEANNADDNA